MSQCAPLLMRQGCALMQDQSGLWKVRLEVLLSSSDNKKSVISPYFMFGSLENESSVAATELGHAFLNA